MAKGSLQQVRLRGLVDAVERLAGARAIEDVVEVIRTTARRLIGSDGIAVILRDGDFCHYVEEDAVDALWKGQRFPLTSCVSGWAMLNCATAVIPDVSRDPRVPFHLYRDTFVRGMVMVPVHVADPIGAIGAYWSEPHDPSDEARETLETLARAAATAIENVRLVAALSDALNEAEQARDELRHRVKNAFTAAQALATLALPREHASSLSTRLSALARAHDLIDRKLATEASIMLADLVEGELEPYRIEAPDRVSIAGPPVVLPSATAIALGLVLNELATNALKYGALSTVRGEIAIRWTVSRGRLTLSWQESGGPAVQASAAESFGSRLLKRLIERQLGGTIARTLAPQGIACTIAIPHESEPAFSTVG